VWSTRSARKKTGQHESWLAGRQALLELEAVALSVLLDLSDGLAHLAALSLGWLFVIAVPFNVSDEPLPLAQALEALQHLLN
jgi:hypothetical protein